MVIGEQERVLTALGKGWVHIVRHESVDPTEAIGHAGEDKEGMDVVETSFTVGPIPAGEALPNKTNKKKKASASAAKGKGKPKGKVKGKATANQNQNKGGGTSENKLKHLTIRLRSEHQQPGSTRLGTESSRVSGILERCRLSDWILIQKGDTWKS
ncbi:hypothetical protein PSTG_13046 [Puccinia striiformis f. sp. tritici PST-78]|uniref:Uncharacterized protein n=1 Tax=Puccinia striiformis f. sp. tritici PST-78 TaxID=1165861 RepID=A0A0L0V2T9_9BASI|nr:hypothetical protein PSTG_13046 [Puccinia striiformis f. sp. tritici PST-78]